MTAKTYKIVRSWRDHYDTVTVRRGLSLAQAQAHCRRADTRGTDTRGPWFDGYDHDTGVPA